MKSITTICAILAAISLSAQTNEQQTDMRQVERVATAAMPTLRGLSEKMPEVIGLRAEEAATAQLAAPLPVYWVGLRDLKSYRAGTDPRTLLKDMKTFFYPVTVGGNARSSITVKQRGTEWVATDFGQPELTKRVAAAHGAGGGFLVRVPALNTYFVGRTSGGTLLLTPIADVPGTDLRANVPAPADTVFAALAAQAAHINEDFPS
jgi:hypothetical protein